MYSWNTTNYYMYADGIYNEFADANITDATQSGFYSNHNNAYRTQVWIHFGPTPGSNPAKLARVAGSKGYIYIQTEWYYTYDEVEIFPETLTQAGRDTIRLGYYYRSTIGGAGWNNAWRDSSISELAPGHSASPADPCSGLLLKYNARTGGTTYNAGVVQIAPRSAIYREASSYGLYPAQAGDTIAPVRDDLGYLLSVNCSSNAISYSTQFVEVFGRLKTPIRWYGRDTTPVTPPKTFGDYQLGTLELRCADDEAGLLVDLPYNWNCGAEPKGGYTPDNRRVRPGNQCMVIPSGADNAVLFYTLNGVRGKAWVWGAVIRQYVESVPEMPIEELGVEDPALYYTPDNLGSLFIVYSGDNATGAFSTASALKFYLSGGAGNTDPNASLGGVVSTTELSSGENSLFDDAGTLEVYVGLVTYRCLYLKNTSGQAAVGVRVWQSKSNLENNYLLVGADPAGIGGTAQTIDSEIIAPTLGATLVPLSEGGGFTIPVLGAGQQIPLWFGRQFVPRRTDVLTPDAVTLNVSVMDM
jgi:hypothetical protein